FYILQKAYRTGEISPHDIIAEATSGNTGISFSAIGSYLGHKVIIYMPDWMSAERKNLIQSYGAEVRLVSREEGGFLGSIAMTEEFYKKGGVFLPRQFSNPDNTDAHYYTTGQEIVNQLSALGLKADGVVAGV
ncbi:MAG: pyridoxal-phosphate dependent enzyme, partial [Clostridiales bacterium]